MAKTKIGTAWPESLLEEIDETVDNRRDLDSRSEAIRRWTRMGMQADGLFEDKVPQINQRGREGMLRQALIDHIREEFDR